MSTKFKRWTVRIVGTAALPAVLALGLGGVAASANAAATPTVATHSTTIQQHHHWVVVGIFHSRSQGQNWNRRFNRHHYRYEYNYYRHFRYHGHNYSNVWVLYWYLRSGSEGCGGTPANSA